MTPAVDVFIAFVQTFGPWMGMLALIVVTGVLIARGWANTRFYVQRTQADTQKSVAMQGAENEATLVRAILKFAETMTKANDQASLERQKTFEHLERMTGRLEGLATALLGNTKSSDAVKVAINEFGTQLDEFGGRLKDIPQIKTDVEGLSRRAETFTEGFGKELDAKIGPLLALMTTTNAQTNTLSSTALDIAKEMARAIDILILINEHIKGQGQHEALQTQSE